MVKRYQGTFAILQNGIKPYIENTLKGQHARLIEDATENTYTTAKRVCSKCDAHTLLPKHAKQFCPSQKVCLCKKKTRGRRPCPNGICDSVFEGIIKAHHTMSPNLKNTNISRWSEDYWEIAKCFMAHDSESIEKTDLMDLLHIMANDKIFRMEFGLPASDSDDKADDFLSKVIQACKTIRRQRKIDPHKFVEAYHEDMISLLQAVGDDNAKLAALQLEDVLQKMKQNDEGFYFVLPEKMIRNSETDAKGNFQVSAVDLVVESSKEATNEEDFKFELTTEDFMERLRKIADEHLALANDVLTDTLDGIKLDFVQRAHFLKEPETVTNIYDLPNDSFVETTAYEEIFYKSYNENINSEVLVLYSTTDEKDWFIDNMLRWKSHFNDETCSSTQTIQDLMVLTLPFAQRIGLPVREFCDMASRALETQDSCVVVADLSNESIENNFKLLQNYAKGQTFVRLTHMSQFSKYSGRAKTVLMIGGIKELILSDSESIYCRKYSESIKHCLYRCFRKIGGRNLETLTFNNLVLDEDKTKIYVPYIDNLNTIKLKASKLFPVANFVQHLELENVSFQRSETMTLCESMRGIQSVTFLGQANYILENTKNLIVWQYCPQLEKISTSVITVGKGKNVRLNIKKNDLDGNCDAYFGKSSNVCTSDELSCMMHYAINKEMLGRFTRDDFEEEKSEIQKQFILDAICFDLLQKHQSYVDVYPARYKGVGDIFLICLTKENRFLALRRNSTSSEDTHSGEYEGFRTIEKSIYAFSATDSNRSATDFDETIKNYYDLHYDNINEVVTFHAERLLSEHRNLVSVAVSLRNAKIGGPCIVLYVKAKSYIPFGNQPFPTELAHDKTENIRYSVVVREGYFISLADTGSQRANDRQSNLAMGCSIGAENSLAGGTMGPLVEYKPTGSLNTSLLGFLTACHLFSTPEHCIRALNTNVVQPSDADEDVDINTGRRIIRHNKVCGKVVACKFDEEIDVALVRIDARAPTSTRFITPTFEDLNDAGFSPFGNGGLPMYRNGQSLKVSDLTVRNGNADKRIVKFGKVTGLRRGHLALWNSAVRLEETVLPGHCPVSHPLKVYYQHKLIRQMQVLSPPEKSFFQKGDSGCGVFLADVTNHLWCIGMGIGMLSDSICIVTPIHTILDGLQSFLGIEGEIKLKNFEPEEMATEQ